MATGFKHFIFELLAGLALLLVVHGQDQSGFISISCGLPANSSFTQVLTGIIYTSDAVFIDTGTSTSISPDLKASFQRYVWNLRSFPQGNRNCYSINVTRGTKYLIRAEFLHGNYDGKGNLPEFDLYLGPNIWETVRVDNSSISIVKELIHVPSRNYLHLCLVNTGLGTPFISSIELRPLLNTTYVTESGSLALFWRVDVGSNEGYRYPYDVHDRYWASYNYFLWTTLSTNLTVYSQRHSDYQPPSVVMSTAVTPSNGSAPLAFYWTSDAATTEYYVYLHFAEVVKLEANQSRSFNLTLNGKYWYGPLVPDYLSTTTLYSPSAITGSKRYEFSIFKTETSTLPPLINAIEIHSVKYLLQSETDQGDVDAIAKIKSTYGIKRIWQGDPCAPEGYSWDGLNCSFDANTSPRITSLNLSSSGLIGQISAGISNLVMLQYLDLSNNNLTGSVPDFLSQLQYLRVLNLERNQLSGSVPTQLIARSNNGSLSLSVGDNPNLCGSGSCKTKKNSTVVPIVASLGGLLILSMIVAAILFGLKRRRKQQVTMVETESNIQNPSLESIQRQFTYSELQKITNNFESILGKGGFGKVYRGNIDGIQVAVKMLSHSSIQGFQQFQSEVKLLMRVHHRNITTLVGYCYEGTYMGLIYEYMANGDLEQHLSGEKAKILSWEDRLRIATDAAQGLEYMHHGCKPPIIHRDVKCTNILLNENFHAKLADFGLSKFFPTDGGTHVSTRVAGTPGYLDPEYYISNWLTEKSDVYSFGVVLLEIITSRPAIEKSQERTHVSQWVNFLLEKGDIINIVDPKLRGNFNINSAWKFVELAMACVSPTCAERPTMREVVAELNECLATELARTKKGHESQDSNEIMNMNLTIQLSPLAR
ncbi:LRR receptor-like serine/threonine-protein kinase IOS1 isoform X2 [Alnus glutinosa]|uniref:LRR receptor-like serine/threonine-protein kinase IOS1 isoform X2 n=1 Tax=Alnus glutinosa TaxID=3517 RepID=UPI002D7697CE|nr:LRR receptor-like serine/threonine-protein kinase IOS1 isoform X2 [Alnus glutinosa]